MNAKLHQLCAGTIFTVVSLGFSSGASAQYQIPSVYIPDTNALNNGGMALELCKQYIYQANSNPNSLELQQIALACQNIQAEYALCIVQTRPEAGLACMENASQYLGDLLQYMPYLQ